MLVNGATGIAAGYATNMPPHNMNETVDATIYRIQNPECSLEDLMEIIPGPDFPTGGIVQGAKGIHDAFETGKGRVVVRAKCEIEQTRTNQQIIITEIPYEVIKGQLVKKMDEIRLSKDIDGVLDVRDESDRNGMRIVVDVKKEADANLILNYNYNNVTIIDKRPVQVGLCGLLDAFIAFRKEVVLKRSRYELDKMEKRTHIIEGLMKAVSILDEVIRIIRASKDKADSKKNLMNEFGFDEPQAEAIVSMRLYRLSNTDIQILRNEFAELVNRIEETKAIIENENVLKSVIIKELRAVKNEYGDARRTKIEKEVQDIVIDKAAMVTSERVVVTCSRDGYVKRVSLRSYNASSDTSTGLKNGDVLIGTLECDTLDTLLLFTSKGNYASLPVWQIQEAKWKDMGVHLNSVIRIDGDDKIINAIVIKDFNTYAWIVTLSSNGQIKKTPVSAWKVDRNSKVMTAMNIAKNAEMLNAFIAYHDQKIVVVSKEGYSYQFAMDQLPSTGVKSKGVKALNTSKDDALAYGCAINADTPALLYVTSTGACKRVHMEEVVEGNRPMKGNLICKKLKTNPSILRYVKGVTPGDNLVFMDSQNHEIHVSDVPFKTRETGFSSPVTMESEWSMLMNIEECRIIDIPENAEDEEVHEDIEKITLF